MISSRTVLQMFSIFLLVLLASCDSDRGPGNGFAGAGDGDGGTDEVSAWVFPQTPRFSTTRSAIEPDEYFDGPLDAAFFDDGSIVIQDGGTRRLTYLDSTGVPTHSAGGEGDGPGEFRSISSLLRAPGGSSIWLWDRGSGRLSHFDRSGDFLGSIAPPVGSGAPPAAVLPGPLFATIAEDSEPGSPRRYLLRDSLWAVVREVPGPPEPDPPVLVVEVSGTFQNHQLPEGCVGTLMEVVVGNELFAVDAARGVVRSVARDTSAREVYRTTERQVVVPEIREALEATIERRFSIPGREVPAGVRRTALQDLNARLGEQLPAWQRAIADPAGRIWLERAECPTDRGHGTHYDVVGIDGRHAGSIVIPDGMTLLAVLRGNLLVRRTDDLGVQHVEVYGLVENEASQGR